MKQTIRRKFEFDAGHRVMNEQFACFNVHGHRYYGEIIFKYENPDPIGYAIDFKEIKRVGLAYINDYFDHVFIANPMDTEVIKLNKKLGTKLYLMTLAGDDYCNPTAENISKEIFMSMEYLFNPVYKSNGMVVHKIILYETPNCSVACKLNSITKEERENFTKKQALNLMAYREEKGILNYDDRNN